MHQHYPSCFEVDAIIPLALRISNQIFAINSPYSKVKIRKVLGRYKRSAKCRKNLITGANKLDLSITCGFLITSLKSRKGVRKW